MSLAIREALQSFRRAPLLSALSIITIGFSLFAFGLFGLVALNIRNTVRLLEERVEIRAFLIDGTPVEVAAMAVSDVGSFPEVLKADYANRTIQVESGITNLAVTGALALITLAVAYAIRPRS